MKIAYAGFDLMAAALAALLENNEIVKLFTCAVDGVYETNTAVIAIAERVGAPYTTQRITREDINELVNGGCELLVSAGYYYRIPIDPRLKMMNIHPSLLPYGRGAWPMPLAILDRLPESGVTVHKTEESFDTGDILLQERFALDADETLVSFMEKVNGLLPGMMRELTSDFGRLWSQAKPQGDGVYLDEPDPEDYTLSRGDTVMYADRVLRAFYGFPVPYRDGDEVRYFRFARAVKGDNSGKSAPLSDGFIENSKI
jgi:methionyl-tRNA formyltransferase